ncbi:hypothetical protein DAPPUDRAFT_336417 [Daphnia pulex]|uniref:Uncharacterized protein n=1 Tax=Daphnia pulex TaxID=6669 RepID=E9HZN8_DAPPU|nr:hypothetical protein DAPPUDRAFT_336417 [Daphnia pulex]|eukprot:EFX62793.1 hypothetical protein DAPPUDRAFT_336417 [Daphnia pulex]
MVQFKLSSKTKEILFARCTFLNKPEDKECAVCEPMTGKVFHFLMEYNLQQPLSPDYDKIMNEYLAAESSEGEGDEEEAKKDEPQEETTAGNEKQEKSETNTAGPSNWKKRKIRKRDRKEAKKARAGSSSSSSSSDDFINTTLADQFNEKCDSSSDDSE